MKDEFKEIRVAEDEEECVRIHYDFGPCWILLPKVEALELAEKIVRAVNFGEYLPLEDGHLTDL